jgi:hypothetical protein
MPERTCYAYAEDAPSCSVIRRLVEFQREHSTSGVMLRLKAGFPENKHGNSNLKKIIPGVSNMAKAGITIFILTDLDSAVCASELIKSWVPMQAEQREMPAGFLFRIAVREVESWLIADRDVLAATLGIPKSNFSADPDSLEDPKAHLLGVIRAKGVRKIHRDMLPGSNSRIGPEYNNVLCGFVKDHWDPERAALRSAGLRRALEALKKV